VIKRKHPVCFYVMSLATQGELYRLVEMTESLSDNLIRYLFFQLLQGLHQLH
jgi:serine/threonine protein kinase